MAGSERPGAGVQFSPQAPPETLDGHRRMSLSSVRPDARELVFHLFGRSVHPELLDVRASFGLGDNLELFGRVENVFDTDPPAARLEYSYDPFIGTAKGRTFKIGTKVRF